MRVLVLGGTGFIGTRIVDELVLRHGFAVRVTVRDYRKAVRLGRLPVEWVEGSADDPALLRAAASGCDAVICCAHPFSSPREAAVALSICRAIAVAAAETSTRRLVFVSSTAVYGTALSEITDDTPARPDTEYGRIKLRCETQLCREHDAGTIRLVVLRPSIVYGPFSPSWTILPAKQMQTGQLVLPQDASGSCNAIYVDDVARAAGQALRLETRVKLTLNLNAANRARWRELYAPYEAVVRPGALVEWPIDAILRALESERLDRRSWNAAKRAIRDRAVRDRLNEIPLFARFNQVGKALGWRGLPPTAVNASPAADARPTSCPPHVPIVPNRGLLDLYLRAPYVDGSSAKVVLGITPREIAAGMGPTLEWLEWAGWTRPSQAGPSRSAGSAIAPALHPVNAK